jgi:hypothetical protein
MATANRSRGDDRGDRPAPDQDRTKRSKPVEEVVDEYFDGRTDTDRANGGGR